MEILEKDDVAKLLLCNSHLGKKTCENLMKGYIWRERKDGIFIINISKTMKKIKLAARAIAAVKNTNNIIVISTGQISQKAVMKFSSLIECQMVTGKWVSGKFTNHMCKEFLEPELIIIANPNIDHQSVVEASQANIPTIAFCNTDTPLKYIDVAIPGNNESSYSVALLWWLLTREVLKYKGQIEDVKQWNIPVQVFLDITNKN